MNENKDLLDLCRLNQMEDNIENSPSMDKETTQKAINWKKRQLTEKIIREDERIKK